MFDRTMKCNLPPKMLRLNSFFFVFTLRQGTIMIAVHQIAISCILLIIMLVGISHLGAMLSMLNDDMEDDADRHGLYAVAYGEHITFHYGQVISTNNQRRFANAKNLASVTVMFLYGSTITLALYLMCCISLLHGAVKYKREYVIPWIVAACIGMVILATILIIGLDYPVMVNFFGGLYLYYIINSLFYLAFLYGIYAVCCFAMETGSGQCARSVRAASDERGERLLLLDHAAHSSLLSAAQLNKLNSGTRSQFV